MSAKPLGSPPTTFLDIMTQDKSLELPSFTADDAFEIGIIIRNRLREFTEKAAVIEIALGNSHQVLFRAVSRPGIVAENDNWVTRKRNFVLRFGWSTWAGHNLFEKGNEEAFKNRFQLGEKAGDYAIHGGGFPVRVKGVEGVIGAIIVSGLAQEQDHQIIVESVQEFLARK